MPFSLKMDLRESLSIKGCGQTITSVVIHTHLCSNVFLKNVLSGIASYNVAHVILIM